MSEPKRMHPVAAISGLIAALKEFLVPLVLIYFFGRGESQYDWMFGLILILPFAASIGRWMRFTYHIEGTTLKVNEGLFVRKKVTVPKNRVQSVDITAGIIQRIFGLVSVKVQTAGNEQAAVDLTAVTKDDAREIMETLRGETVSEAIDDSTITGEPSPEVYGITMKQLLAAGATSGQIGVILSIVFTLASQFDDMIDFDQIIETFDKWAPFLSNSTFTLIFTAIVGTWLLAILGTIATYYNFSLVRKERELVVRYGLLKTKQVSIPYNRVQAIRFSEGILRQPFGYGSLYVESAGQGDERQSSSCIIAPYIRADEVDHVLGEILPDLTFEVQVLEHPPERSQWRYVLRLVRPAVLVAGLASWLIPFGWVSLLLLPLSVVLGMAQYRTAGFKIDGDKLLIRTRSIGRTTAVIKRSRVQAAEFKWNPLMHRRDLWSYNVTLASVSKNLNFGISYLGVEQQPAFRSWFIDVLAAQEAPAVPIDEDADHRVESDHVPTVPPSPDLPGEAEG